MCDGMSPQIGYEADVQEDSGETHFVQTASNPDQKITKQPNQILIVEDQEELRSVLADLIGTLGFEVAGAQDGVAAWEWLEVRDSVGAPLPGLIILDLMMPRMDGWEFRRRQLEDHRFLDIPVLLMSGALDVESEAKLLRAERGFTKPVPFARLHAAIEEIMARR